jgi:hypothetical protein
VCLRIAAAVFSTDEVADGTAAVARGASLPSSAAPKAISGLTDGKLTLSNVTTAGLTRARFIVRAATSIPAGGAATSGAAALVFPAAEALTRGRIGAEDETSIAGEAAIAVDAGSR